MSGSDFSPWGKRDFDPDYLNESDLDQPITLLNFAGYRNEGNMPDDAGNSPTNHWTVFLAYGDGKNSVQLDMSPGYGDDGLRGKLIVKSSPLDVTENAIKILPLHPKDRRTVREILQLIASKQREKYVFTEEEEGCRFWVYTLTLDLEAAGFVPPGSAQSVWNAVSFYYHDPSGRPEPRPIKQGRFYQAGSE